MAGCPEGAGSVAVGARGLSAHHGARRRQRRWCRLLCSSVPHGCRAGGCEEEEKKKKEAAKRVAAQAQAQQQAAEAIQLAGEEQEEEEEEEEEKLPRTSSPRSCRLTRQKNPGIRGKTDEVERQLRGRVLEVCCGQGRSRNK